MGALRIYDKEYQKVAEGCLDWIDRYGDLDGDGFQEYKTFSSPGYENMGWKDASDAVVYADGTQVKQPKALCELQAYVYDAKTRMAEIFEALDDGERAKSLLQQAETLKKNFNQVFWMEDDGCYAYGLDPDKKQITPSHRTRDRYYGVVLQMRRRQNVHPGGFYKKICGAAGVFVHFQAIILHIILTFTN